MKRLFLLFFVFFSMAISGCRTTGLSSTKGDYMHHPTSIHPAVLPSTAQNKPLYVIPKEQSVVLSTKRPDMMPPSLRSES